MTNPQPHGREDAIAMLRRDHKNFETQLAIYSALSMVEHQKKKQLIEQMSIDLSMHLQIEEKVFYPEVKTHIKGLVGIMNQGIVEHIRLRFLLKQLKAMNGDHLLFDSQVQQLSTNIGKHIARAEADMFPKVSASNIDLQSLGGEMHRNSKPG
jgi:hypothetical protein